MKVLFVWPNKDQFGFKPMGIALLSAILKQNGHQTDLFDTTGIDFGFKDNTAVRSKLKIFKDVESGDFDVSKQKLDLGGELIRKLDDFKPDIVGVSALSDEVPIGFEISRLVKQYDKDIIVIWGNKAATMSPDKILSCKNVDYLCRGEGIEFIIEFVESFARKKDLKKIKNSAYRSSAGGVKKNALRPYFQNLDNLPFFDWTVFDHRQFLKPFDGKMYTGGDHMIYWGCPNQCTYCINNSYHNLYGPKAGRFLRGYGVERIISELKYLVKKWGINFFKFHDEDFCLKPLNYFRKLSGRYNSEVGVPFTIMANARNISEEKVRLLKDMNCVSVTLGIETGNVKLRKEVLKRVETPQEIIEATRILNDAGIRTSAFNMLGIPFENRSTIMETIELNKKAGIRYPNVGFFFPLEGTELKKVAVDKGFFNADSQEVFRNDTPALKFPGISTAELIALRERFVLYIKMPTVLYKFIQRSEQPDTVGKNLTRQLYKIYDECVFANDGVWNDRDNIDKYIQKLEVISGSCA